MTPRAAPQVGRTVPGRWDRVAHARGTALAAVWASVAVISASGPSLVTGSQHHHLPVTWLTAWVWGACATVILTRPGHQRLTRRTVATAVQVWAAAGYLAATAPSFANGSSSTLIPVVPLVAPAVACIVTGLAVLAAKTSTPASSPHAHSQA